MKEISTFIAYFIKSNIFERIKVIIIMFLPISCILFSILYLLDSFGNFSEWILDIPFTMLGLLVETAIMYRIYYSFAKKIVKVSKLSKIDFISKKKYYRDLINDYNLLELGYVDSFKLNKTKDLVVILLSMESRGLISLKHDEIEVLKKDKLVKNSENYIIELINQKSLNKIDVEELERLIQKDCLDDKLLIRKVNKKKKINIFIIIIIIITIILSLILNYNFVHITAFVLTLLLAIKRNPYFRTKKGQDINEQLEGLKLFLKDFTSLDQKQYKEIILWDDYLIFSVLFNHNKKIIDEIFNKFIVT